MARKIAMIGKGNVGSVLAEALQRAGYEVRFGSTDPKQPPREAAAWAEVIILAVPWKAHRDAAQEIREAAKGKVVVDVSNVIGASPETGIGCRTSGAEELQKLLPEAKVVKAFNTIFAHLMRDGHLNGEPLTIFVAGDDAASKETVAKLAEDIGFDVVDAGPLESARHLEPLGLLNINLAYKIGLGRDIGLKLMRKAA